MSGLPTCAGFLAPLRLLGQRTVVPEILDTLPDDHPLAQRARRDLRLFNRVMGNERWLVSTVRSLVKSDERILEIGAGSGRLARRLHGAGFRVDALDRCPPPADWPARQRWRRVDVRSFDDWHDYDVVVANLFFHHLTPAELGRIGKGIAAHSRLVVASEPARHRRFQYLFALLCLLSSASSVSRHDGHASIAAGFSSDELARELRLPRGLWTCMSRSCGRGAYHFIAEKEP